MPEKQNALRRRIAPSVPLTLDLVDDSGAKSMQTFRVSFNMNVGADIQEKTGLRITDFSIWGHVADPNVLRAMLWAAILPLHPEFDTVDAQGKPSDEGLEVIGSYLDESNSDAVFDALWDAYLLYLAPKKRAAAEKWLAEVKAEAEDPKVPLAPAPAPAPATTAPASPAIDRFLAITEKPSAGSNCGPLLDTTFPLPPENSGS